MNPARRVWAAGFRHVPVHVRGSARILKRVLLDYGYLRAARESFPVDRAGNPVAWYTFPAIEYLEQLDFRGRRVFEYGSGASTLWWLGQGATVVAVESDREWYERIKPRLESDRTTYLLAPERDDYVNAIHDHEPFDVVVVDGYWRGRCADQAPGKLKDGGMVILDNSDWMPDVAARLRAADLIEIDFNGFAPLADFSMTTSVFLHRQARFEPKGEEPGRPRGGLPIPEWRRRWLLEDPNATPDNGR